MRSAGTGVVTVHHRVEAEAYGTARGNVGLAHLGQTLAVFCKPGHAEREKVTGDTVRREAELVG